MGVTWLKEYGGLPKSEQDVLLLLMEKRCHFKNSALTNTQMAEILKVPFRRMCKRTKALKDKDFLECFEVQLEEKTKPVKHFYLPNSMTRSITEPATARFMSLKDCQSLNQNPQLEPTVVEGTMKKIDPDEKLGYVPEPITK